MHCLARDAGISQATGYRYLHEGIGVSAAQTPDLHEVLDSAPSCSRVAASASASAVVSGACQHAQMPSTSQPFAAPDDPPRAHLLELIGAVEPWDELERTHRETATQWICSGAPVWRVRKPDVPAMHLVSYFVVLDDTLGQLLLIAHRKAGLWPPAGGHVEPGESPWAAVVANAALRARWHTGSRAG